MTADPGRRRAAGARASLSVPEPAYHGEFYSFDGMVVDPCAVQDHVPIWIGGRTLRSLRRAATLADGWAPFNVGLQQARDWLGRFELPAGFEVVLPPPAPLDPINKPDHTRDLLADTAAHGATIISAIFTHTSLQHYLDNLHALAELHPRRSRVIRVKAGFFSLTAPARPTTTAAICVGTCWITCRSSIKFRASCTGCAGSPTATTPTTAWRLTDHWARSATSCTTWSVTPLNKPSTTS